MNDDKEWISILIRAVILAGLIAVAWCVITDAKTKKLNAYDGVNYYKGTKETYYNLPMDRTFCMISIMSWL